MLEACCADAFEVKYVESDSDIILPVILNYKETGLQSQSKVVPILPYTGVAFVVKRADKKNLPIKTLSSVFSSWSVLVITLLLSVLAGIVAWILVNNYCGHSKINSVLMLSPVRNDTSFFLIT